jgi:predicted transcriptional regulator
LQLASEIGHDWNVVDRNIKTLLKYGIVRESLAYGNVRLYELTETGKTILKLVQELRGTL